MPQKDPVEFHPPQESRSIWILLIVIVALLLAAGWWFWWRPAHAPVPAAQPVAQASGSAADKAASEAGPAASSGIGSAARSETGSVASSAEAGSAGSPKTGPVSSSSEAGSAAPSSEAGSAAPSDAGPVVRPATESSPNVLKPKNPVDVLGLPDKGLPPVAESDKRVTQALRELPNGKHITDFLLLGHSVRRVVATVDNLGRPYAPDNMWPVQPTPGRFLVTGPADAQVIAPENAARYDTFVDFAASVPLGPVVKLYARLYPLFQSAYEALGYPGAYFNDRLVAVLDLLLATPVPTGPVSVQVTHFKGESPSTRPWTRYEYVDPALESLSSGQKILIRMGPENERRLKAVMTDLRRRVATGELAHSEAR